MFKPIFDDFLSSSDLCIIIRYEDNNISITGMIKFLTISEYSLIFSI